MILGYFPVTFLYVSDIHSYNAIDPVKTYVAVLSDEIPLC